MKFKLPKIAKVFLEFIPLVIFLVVYKIYQEDMIIATKYLMGSSVVSVAIMYLFERKVPKVMLYSAVLIVVLGSVTVMTNNSTFIKMKPTLLYALIGLVLLVGVLTKKLFLKNILGQTIKMPDQDWYVFSKRWIYFLFLLAIINEVIWRNFSDGVWIKFKLIGLPICIIVFLFINAPLLMKHIDHK